MLPQQSQIVKCKPLDKVQTSAYIIRYFFVDSLASKVFLCYNTTMEKKIFKFVYKTAEKVILYIMFAFFVIMTILNSCRLLELFTLVSYDIFVDTVGLIFSIILGLFIISTLNQSKYVLLEKELIEQISIFKKKIDYTKISKIIFNDTAKLLYIFFTNEKNKQTYLKINLQKDDIDDFVSSLKQHNPSIIYELTDGK